MEAELNVLILEDNPDDAELLVEHLIGAGFRPLWTRVDDEAGFRAGLLDEPDIVIADYRLPQFDAIAALSLANSLAPTIPVIVVSGQMSEETCVQCIQLGAVDYLLKDRLTRLGPAVRHALSRRELEAGRQQAEQAARDAATILQDLVDGSPTPICLTDEQGRYVLVNSEFERVVDTGRAQLIGRTPVQTVIGDLAGSLAERDADCLRLETVIGAEEEVVHAGRRGTYLSVRYPLTLAGGTRGVAAIYTDISSQKETERALLEAQSVLQRQAQQMSAANARLLEVDNLRTQFIATVSHELRTPLTSILSYAEILATDEALAPEPQMMVEIINRNGWQLLWLVEDLLMSAQIDSGSLKLESAVTNLAEVVDHCCAILRPAALAAGLTVECDIQATLSAVAVGPRNLERVLLNLLSNAIKFSPNGGRVTVTGRQVAPAGAVSVSVRDEGIGVPVDEQRHLGTRFFRSSTSQQRAIGGTGLGLAICKAIVEGYGGHITVDSVLGAGTTVTATLPATCGPADTGPEH